MILHFLYRFKTRFFKHKVLWCLAAQLDLNSTLLQNKWCLAACLRGVFTGGLQGKPIYHISLYISKRMQFGRQRRNDLPRFPTWLWWHWGEHVHPETCRSYDYALARSPTWLTRHWGNESTQKLHEVMTIPLPVPPPGCGGIGGNEFTQKLLEVMTMPFARSPTCLWHLRGDQGQPETFLEVRSMPLPVPPLCCGGIERTNRPEFSRSAD